MACGVFVDCVDRFFSGLFDVFVDCVGRIFLCESSFLVDYFLLRVLPFSLRQSYWGMVSLAYDH